MTLKPVRKTAHYMRAIEEGEAVDLQSLLMATRKVFKTVASTELTLGSGDVVRIQHYRSNKYGVSLHLARYIPGEVAPTLQPKSAAAEDDEGAQSAPAGKEFKEGDSFMLVNAHNVFFCSHGISIEKSRLYLSLLIDKAGLNKAKRRFNLIPATNIDKLRLVHQHGVKAIELGTSAYSVSLPTDKPDGWMNRIFSGVVSEVRALVEKDDTAQQQKLLEDLLVNVELRLDGNSRAAVVTQNFIEHVATSLLEEDTETIINHFTIVTRNNDRITSDQTRLLDTFNVAQENGSISYFGVWDGLKGYFETISKGNLVEQ